MSVESTESTNLETPYMTRTTRTVRIIVFYCRSCSTLGFFRSDAILLHKCPRSRELTGIRTIEELDEAILREQQRGWRVRLGWDEIVEEDYR